MGKGATISECDFPHPEPGFLLWLPNIGRLVWGKLKGYRQWPGLIVTASNCGLPALPSSNVVWIMWFGDLLISKVKFSSLECFAKHFEQHYKGGGAEQFQLAVAQAIQEWCWRSGQPLPIGVPLDDGTAVLQHFRKHCALTRHTEKDKGLWQHSPFITNILEGIRRKNCRKKLSQHKFGSITRDSLTEIMSSVHKYKKQGTQKWRVHLRGSGGGAASGRSKLNNRLNGNQHRKNHNNDRWHSSAASESGIEELGSRDSYKFKPRKSVLKSSVRDYSKLYSQNNNISDDITDVCSHGKGSLKLLPSPHTPISGGQYGRPVWGRLPGYRRWPAVVISHDACHLPPPEEGQLWVFWFGDHYVSKIKVEAVTDFCLGFSVLHRQPGSKLFRRAITEAIREVCHQRGLMQRLQDSPLELVKWAARELVEAKQRKSNCKPPNGITVQTGWSHSPFVFRAVSRLRHQRQERAGSMSPAVTSDSEGDESGGGGDTTDEDRVEGQDWQDKVQQLSDVRSGSVCVEDVCISCASVTCHVTGRHPIFRGGVCTMCREVLASALLDLGRTMTLCVVCAAPGRLVMCDQPKCFMVYCTECLELLVSRGYMEAVVEGAGPWRCFTCRRGGGPVEEEKWAAGGLLVAREDWRKELRAMQEEHRVLMPSLQLPSPPPATGADGQLRPVRVLALFDGIATGLLTLDRLGLAVGVYYSSEVCPDALLVGEVRHGRRLTPLGDVRTLTDEKVLQLCPIDLLIGGSPCNDLSSVNPNRKGLHDPEGTGVLFFEYVRVLKQLKRCNDGRHLFWLYENVASMPEEYRNSISKHLYREPVTVDARQYTAMSRLRYYWGNIPGLNNLDQTLQPYPSETPQQPQLQDFLEKVPRRTAVVSSVNCITGNSNSLTGSGGRHWPVTGEDGRGDTLWCTEIERLFGFPPHYTDVGHLNPRARQRLLGKAWSVQVTERILAPLRRYFQCLEEDTH